MEQQTLEKRMEIVEQQLQSLMALPDRVASLGLQFLPHRDEVRVAFSAVRAEMREKLEQLRLEMHPIHADRHAETLALHEIAIARIGQMGDQMRPGRRAPCPDTGAARGRHRPDYSAWRAHGRIETEKMAETVGPTLLVAGAPRLSRDVNPVMMRAVLSECP